MSYLAWLLLMALCGWIAGQIIGGKGRGNITDFPHRVIPTSPIVVALLGPHEAQALLRLPLILRFERDQVCV